MDGEIETLPNERPWIPMWIENRLELPSCCPITQNPQPGSVVCIRYRAAGQTLAVESIKRYVRSFIGGHSDGTRNMETMIQKIAEDCADALQAPVTVRAELVIMPYQRMNLICRASPHDLLSRNASGGMVEAIDSSALCQPSPTG